MSELTGKSGRVVLSARPMNLRCGYLIDPLGIDTLRPRFSWLPPLDQVAYQIQVTSVWDSGRVQSAESAHVEYAGKPLTPGQRYRWRVRVWDRRGNASAWSEPAVFGVAPVWQARWIGEKSDTPWRENEARPSPLLRKSFWLKTRPRRATAYASALGLYELRLNGQRVGDQMLAPEWTDYRRRVQFQAHDVTGLLARGANAIGMMLAPGWYAGRLGLGAFAVGGGLTWAKGEYRSIRGPIQVAWRHEAGLFQLQLTVPPNTTASVQLPGQRSLRRVAEGTHHFETQTGG